MEQGLSLLLDIRSQLRLEIETARKRRYCVIATSLKLHRMRLSAMVPGWRQAGL